MTALFGEGRHPNANEIEAELITGGATAKQAMAQTQLGRRFPTYGVMPELRRRVTAAYHQYNVDNGRPAKAAIDEQTRNDIRRRTQAGLFREKHGHGPASDADLRTWLAQQQQEQKKAVAGWEFVFAPPKSVSVAWALGDDATRELIGRVHAQAVRDTLGYAENNVAFTRQGDSGEAQVDVRGLIAAMWEHWDSRAGDPHLHVHVTISAKAQRATDGTWTTLDGRTILAAAVTLSEHYGSRLRDMLRDHGASWTERPGSGISTQRSIWELDGVPQPLLHGFSQRASVVEAERARQIVAFRDEHGREPSPKELWELNRRAQYATRIAKRPPRTLAEHRAEWAASAEAMAPAETWQATPDSPRGLGGRVFAGAEPLSRVDLDALAQATLAAVAERYSHFNRWLLLNEAHRQTAGLRVATDAREALIEGIADAIIHDPETVALRSAAVIDEPAALRRDSGESVFHEHNSARYTTTATLQQEQQLVEYAAQTGGHRLKESTLAAAMLGRTLNDGQRDMVISFARSGRRLQQAIAPAGAGKTTAMTVFGAAWRKAGGRVFAFGPSAVAAAELGRAMHASPHTLHQLTVALRHGTQWRNFDLRAGDVLVIDEAAMAGTPTLHRAITYAINRGADVRLVADDAQLGAVEAGGVVRLIDHDIGSVRFNQVVRFIDPAEAEASLLIRAGNPEGIDFYADHGRIRAGSLEVIRSDAHAAWRADLDAGRRTLLIVPDLDDVVALNREAQHVRIHRGEVATERPVPLHDGTSAAVGDWVVTRMNNRELALFDGRDFVKNGDTWHLQQLRADGSMRVRHRHHGGTALLPAGYVAAYVELAYATTINRCEGMTSDTAHTVVLQRTTREQLYPSITRGTTTNRLYVQTIHHVADSHHETPPDQDPKATLFGVLMHVGVETSATEQRRADTLTEHSLATLRTRYDYAAHLAAHTRHTHTLTHHAPSTLDQPAEPALRQTLLNADDLGWHIPHLITRALTHGPIDDADDPAALLQWRINHHITTHPPPPEPPNPADTRRYSDLLAQHGADLDDHPATPTLLAAIRNAERHGYPADSLIPSVLHQRPLAGATDPAAVLAWRVQQHMATHAPIQPAIQHHAAHHTAEFANDERALPWLARTPPDSSQHTPQIAAYLAQLDEAIRTRSGQLQHQVREAPPLWTAGLGPRPAHGTEKHRWEHLVGLAAAYRESYGITTNDPATPLGTPPQANTPRHTAFRAITAEWNNTTDTPEDPELDHTIAALTQHRAAAHHQDHAINTHPGHAAASRNYEHDHHLDSGHDHAARAEHTEM